MLVRPLGATDPRDKVFGLFGLMNRFLPPGMKPQIPEYNVSVLQVYYSVTCMLAEHAPTVSILSRKEDQALTAMNLPSWVPDYSVAIAAGRQVKAPPCSGLDTSLAWKPRAWRRHAVREKLRLKGTKIDVVSDMAPLPELSGGLDHPAYIGSILRLCRQVKLSYASGQRVMEMLSRTLTLNRSDFDHVPRGAYLSPLQRFFAYFIAAAHVSGMRTDGRKPMINFVNGELVENPVHEAMLAMLVDLEKISEAEPQDWGEVMHLQQRLAPAMLTSQERTYLWTGWKHDYPPNFVEKAVEGTGEMLTSLDEAGVMIRSLFVTQRGYLGGGPASMELGDEIWLISGGSIPYARRKTRYCENDERETVRELVGEAYLHGFSYGWELLKTERISEELTPIALRWDLSH